MSNKNLEILVSSKKAKRMAASLIDQSCWFEIHPYPGDMFMVVAKDEAGPEKVFLEYF